MIIIVQVDQERCLRKEKMFKKEGFIPLKKLQLLLILRGIVTAFAILISSHDPPSSTI